MQWLLVLWHERGEQGASSVCPQSPGAGGALVNEIRVESWGKLGDEGPAALKFYFWKTENKMCVLIYTT